MAYKNVDWNLVKADKDAGMSVKDLATKHSVSRAGIYSHFRASKPATSANGNSRVSASYAQVIADLTEKRDKMTATIAMLEELAAA